MNHFETFLIEQCAPVLAGIKPGSMFPYIPQNQERLPQLLGHWNGQLQEKGVRVTSLKRCRQNGGYLIYVYRPEQVAQILSREDVRTFLETCGYEQGMTLTQTLRCLTRRLCQSPDFPHEVGIFLGYPLHDVLGFIRHRGKNSLCCGCWKVYAEPQKALDCFRQFRVCTEIYRSLYRRGRTAAQLTVAA